MGTFEKPLGGLLGNRGTHNHIIICHHNPHLITNPTNHLNSGTLQVGSIGHPSILILLILLNSSIGHKGGGDNPTPNHHLSPHLIICILIIQPIPGNFYQGLCLQFPFLHNNLITSKIQTLHDLHCYLHNWYLIQIIRKIKLLTALICKLLHPTLFWLYMYMRYNYDLEEL